MSLFRSSVERRDDALTLIPPRPSATSWSGVTVTPRTALSNPAVWRCWFLICGLVSGFPIDALRKAPDGTSSNVEPKPPLLVKPSGTVSRRAWVHQAMESIVLDGNVVGIIVARDGIGHPTQIELQDMSRVSVRQTSSGEWLWRIGGKPIDAERIWHHAMNPPPGHILGRSLIEHASEVIGVGLAAQRYGAQYFGDGGHPTMVVRNTEKSINQTVAKVVKKRVVDALRGNREPLVIGKGWEVSPWQSNPGESALVEVWASNTTNVCNYFGVPAELLGGTVSNSMTYSNLEQRSLDLLKFCVGLWLSPLEEGLSDALPASISARFNVDALLRLDTLARYRVHEIALRSGLDDRNHRRSLEDLPPIPGGEETLWPPYRAFPTDGDQ